MVNSNIKIEEMVSSNIKIEEIERNTLMLLVLLKEVKKHVNVVSIVKMKVKEMR